MTRPSLLFLTDLSNGDEGEDLLIANFLRSFFDIVLCHPAVCQVAENQADLVIIRNVWNLDNYGKPQLPYRKRFIKKGLNVHDDLYRTTEEDKSYLIDLWHRGYPSIPTVDSVKDLHQLPRTGRYFVKPKDGFDAIDAIQVAGKKLKTINLSNKLIQPFIDFEYEVSFYFLDKQFLYALYTPNKHKRWSLEEYMPTKHDFAFAEMFIRWNKQKFGIERIDACRTKSGDLLLIEVTDQGGVFLSLQDLDSAKRGQFLERLKDSLIGRLD